MVVVVKKGEFNKIYKYELKKLQAVMLRQKSKKKKMLRTSLKSEIAKLHE